MGHRVVHFDALQDSSDPMPTSDEDVSCIIRNSCLCSFHIHRTNLCPSSCHVTIHLHIVQRDAIKTSYCVNFLIHFGHCKLTPASHQRSQSVSRHIGQTKSARFSADKFFFWPTCGPVNIFCPWTLTYTVCAGTSRHSSANRSGRFVSR